MTDKKQAEQPKKPVVDMEATIKNILAKQSRYTSINETKLRADLKANPGNVVSMAKFVRAEIVYID